GPATEEFVFRSCMVSIVAYSGASFSAMVFGLPLVFGIAHLNHGHEIYVKKGRTPQALKQATLICIAKLLYTSVFGWFATYLFLRTSSFWAACLSHTLCNILGLPEVGNIKLYGHWGKWIYLAHFLGLVFFGLLLKPLTDPSLYGDATSLAYWPITVHT
ncbi:CAAX prenyl protease, partial [Entomortierella beljakovae]